MSSGNSFFRLRSRAEYSVKKTQSCRLVIFTGFLHKFSSFESSNHCCPKIIFGTVLQTALHLILAKLTTLFIGWALPTCRSAPLHSFSLFYFSPSSSDCSFFSDFFIFFDALLSLRVILNLFVRYSIGTKLGRCRMALIVSLKEWGRRKRVGDAARQWQSKKDWTYEMRNLLLLSVCQTKRESSFARVWRATPITSAAPNDSPIAASKSSSHIFCNTGDLRFICRTHIPPWGYFSHNGISLDRNKWMSQSLGRSVTSLMRE